MKRGACERFLFRTMPVALLWAFIFVMFPRAVFGERLNEAKDSLAVDDTVSKEVRPEPMILDFTPDSVKQRVGQERKTRSSRQRLTALGNQIQSPAQIDTMRGLSPEDRAFLHRRYQILNPLD